MFDYDYYMNKIDDRTTTVVTGHLLVEQRLRSLAATVFSNPKYVNPKKSKLSFNELIELVQPAAPQPDNSSWKVVKKLNKVRNLYAHNLEPPDLQSHLSDLFNLDERLADEKDDEATEVVRLKLVIRHCFEFLLSLDFQCSGQKT